MKLKLVCARSEPLPPEVRLQLRTAGCQEVVKVHQGVHAGVQERTEAALASADKSTDRIKNKEKLYENRKY